MTERLIQHCTEETLPLKWSITRVEGEGDQRMYVSTPIEKKGKDPYSRFVVETIGNLNKQLESLNAPISRYKTQGRLRSQREIRDIKETREKQKRQIPRIMNVLCGREKLPVKFIKVMKEGKSEIVGIKIHLLNGLKSSLSVEPQTSP